MRPYCFIQANTLKLTLMPLFVLGVLLAQASPAYALVMQKVHFQDASASTRIVMELSDPPRDLAIYDQPGKPMTVSFRGIAPSLRKPLNRNFSWPNLSGVYIDNRNGKIQMFIKRNMTGTVKVDTEMNRLIVNIPHYYYQVNDNDEISPGVRYLRFSQRGPQGPVRINVLEIDPKNPAVEIMPALAANKMGSKSNVARMVTSHQAVAGINGSFFKQDVGIPLGILIINQELVAGPLYDRVALGITETNELVMDRVHLAGEVILPENGVKVPLHNINQPRVNPNHTVIYSTRWGQRAPGVPTDGIQIQLRHNQVTEVSTTEPLDIPKDGVVISGPKTLELTQLANLDKTKPVQLNVYTLPDWSGMKHALGGGPYLVKDGRPYIDLHAEHFSSKSLGYREPRSAAGITRDGKLLLVTVDGRQRNVSVGMTLHELAYLMQKLGSVHAMNLDGGSSTQMALFGKTVNSPSAGQVGVSNSLIVRRTDGGNVALQE